MKEKLKAIWKIIRCKGFYVAADMREPGQMWNSFYEINTDQAQTIIRNMQQIVEQTYASEKFLLDVKTIINQPDIT